MRRAVSRRGQTRGECARVNSNHPLVLSRGPLSRQRGVGVDGRASRAVGFRAFARWRALNLPARDERLGERSTRAMRTATRRARSSRSSPARRSSLATSDRSRSTRRRAARDPPPAPRGEPSPVATASSSARRAREIRGAVDGNVRVERRVAVVARTHGSRRALWKGGARVALARGGGSDRPRVRSRVVFRFHGLQISRIRNRRTPNGVS